LNEDKLDNCKTYNQFSGTLKTNHMKRAEIITFIFLFSIFQAFSQTPKTVRFDGLYQSETYNNFRYFLRFYSDSTVISATSNGEVNDIIKWLKKPFDQQGQYEIKGNKIYFSTTSDFGTVVYEGVIDSEYKLQLKVKSLINGHLDEKLYYFIKL
jgi:hypothetical protein